MLKNLDLLNVTKQKGLDFKYFEHIFNKGVNSSIAKRSDQAGELD